MMVWHIESHVDVPGGSHVSPRLASTHPSPHVDEWQAFIEHSAPVPHTAHEASGVAAWHFCPACPFTVLAAHTCGLTLHGSALGHEFGAMVHENVQSLSQPVPGPLPLPKSHCSPLLTVPLPQSGVVQTPFWHVPLFGHGVPFAGGVPRTHFWPECPLTTTVVHVFVPAHRSCVTHEFGPVVHEK
jgi:hypothetical protein